MKNGIDKLVDELTAHCMEQIGYYYNGSTKAASEVLKGLIESLRVKQFVIDKYLAEFKKGDPVKIISLPLGVKDQSIVGKIGIISAKETETTFRIKITGYNEFVYNIGDFEKQL